MQQENDDVGKANEIAAGIFFTKVALIFLRNALPVSCWDQVILLLRKFHGSFVPQT